MTEYNAIVEDLNRCVGCYACEVACKKQNNLSQDESWIRVSQIGPELVNGKLSMDYVISMTQDCTLCDKRIEKGLQPFCVSICPSKALVYCDTAQKLLENMKKERIQVVNLKESARKKVVYG